MTAKRKRADEEPAPIPGPKPDRRNTEERSARPAGVELAHAIGIMTGTSADGIDVALTMTVVGIGACWLPARRPSRSPPHRRNGALRATA